MTARMPGFKQQFAFQVAQPENLPQYRTRRS